MHPPGFAAHDVPVPIEIAARVVLITGVMAAGKSTVAQALAERLARSVHVRGDVFRRMIVTGAASITPDGGAAMEAELRLRYRIGAMVANEYAAAGYTVVLQDIVLGPDLEAYVAHLTSHPVAVVVLAPRPGIVAEREAGRPKSGYGDWTVESLDTHLRTQTPRLGLWLDSSEQTVEQTVDEILARLPESLVVAPP